MDTYRTTEVADELNVPLPRLLRFVADRDDVVRDGNRIRLRATAVQAALAHFGVIPKVDGLALAERRYHLRGEASVVPMVAAMVRVDECEPDELVQTPKDVLVQFFHRRVPELVASLGRWDDSALNTELAAKIAEILRADG